MSSNGACLNPREENDPRPKSKERTGVIQAVRDKAAAVWKRFRGWGIIAFTVLSLPLIEPLVGTILANLPGTSRVVVVEYPQGFRTTLESIPAFLGHDLGPAITARLRLIAGGNRAEIVLCAASMIAFSVLLARHLIPAFIILWRRQRDRLGWASLVIGVIAWLQVIVTALAPHLGARREIAGGLLPSYQGVENGALWCRKLIELWFGVDVTYFGFSLKWLTFLGNLELELFFLFAGIALFLCWLSALSVFDYTWAKVGTAGESDEGPCGGEANEGGE